MRGCIIYYTAEDFRNFCFNEVLYEKEIKLENCIAYPCACDADDVVASYRAAYGVKGVEYEGYPNFVIVDGISYYKWNKITWGFDETSGKAVFVVQTTKAGELSPDNGAFYLTGNPELENVYNAETFEMSKVQPLELSDVIVVGGYSNREVPENFDPVINSYASSSIDYPMVYRPGRGTNFVIYTKIKNVEKPYVSDILAVDQFSIYRAYGPESGITIDQITEEILFSTLINQGATDVLTNVLRMEKTHLSYGF